MLKKIFLYPLILATCLLFIPKISSAITVGPVKIELSVDPGQTIKSEVFLQNEGDGIRTFYPVFEKFTEDNGEKVFLKEESDLSTWISFATSSVTLKSQEQKFLPFTLEVPKNAPPGGHFAVIWWSTAPANPKPGEQVSIVTRAGVLVYLRVSGSIIENGEIVNFSTSNSGKVFWGLPVEFSATFFNKGNVHLKPKGDIIIKNIFGKQRAVLTVNKFGSQVLPQSRKTFSSTWDSDDLFFGPYKAQIALVYGEQQKELSKEFWLFVVPIKTLIIVIVGLILVFFVLPFGIKRYNRWIVSRSLNN